MAAANNRNAAAKNPRRDIAPIVNPNRDLSDACRCDPTDLGRCDVGPVLSDRPVGAILVTRIGAIPSSVGAIVSCVGASFLTCVGAILFRVGAISLSLVGAF